MLERGSGHPLPLLTPDINWYFTAGVTPFPLSKTHPSVSDLSEFEISQNNSRILQRTAWKR